MPAGRDISKLHMLNLRSLFRDIIPLHGVKEEFWPAGEMKTRCASCLFVGPLQIHVYLILGLQIFFIAFTFFVDVFTQHVKFCEDKSNLNHTDEADSNISIIINRTDNHNFLESVSIISVHVIPFTRLYIFKAYLDYYIGYIVLYVFCDRVPRVMFITFHMDRQHTWQDCLSDLYSVELYLTSGYLPHYNLWN